SMNLLLIPKWTFLLQVILNYYHARLLPSQFISLFFLSFSVPDPTLFSRDIGQILLQKTAEKEDELKKAFQTLDVDQTLTVTKGEFRRVIETFLFPLTQAEFDAMLAEVCYVIAVYNHLEAVLIDVKNKISTGFKPIAKNVKSIIRSCRLFDYNHSGQIQRHTLRHILEITCFRMKDSEFEKDSNVMDYKKFLKNFGINTDTVKEKSTENQVPGMSKHYKLYSLQLCSAYQDIEKAFRAIDVSQSGFISLDYLKSVINGFVFPLPNETFQESSVISYCLFHTHSSKTIIRYEIFLLPTAFF
uniref:EF-hand domain-containing protein n=1 Tax=Dromaius novaehollandiae TaxID=8790 RepID=A0A8C4J1L6_DRONO